MSTAKKAGRPKKHDSTAHQVKMEGIVTKPTYEDFVVEMLMTQPTIFKKMLKLYSEYNNNEILLHFSSKGVAFKSFARKENTLIITRIFGKDINRYYCEAPVKCYISCAELCKIPNYIEPEYDYEFLLGLKPTSDGYVLQVQITNKSLNTNDIIEINDIKPKDPGEPPVFMNDELSYPIAMQVTSKSIKRKFTSLMNDFNSNAKFISNPNNNIVNITVENETMTSTYEGDYPSIPTNTSPTENRTVVEIDLKIFKPFMKNAVDEHTNLYISRNKTICLSSDFGRVKSKGDAIGTIKLYKWHVAEAN